jgi:hypothetical protein
MNAAETKAQKEHGKDVHAIVVDVAPKDREGPEGSRRDGNEKDADKFIHDWPCLSAVQLRTKLLKKFRIFPAVSVQAGCCM